LTDTISIYLVYTDDEASSLIWNFGTFLPDYTVSTFRNSAVFTSTAARTSALTGWWLWSGSAHKH